MRSIRCLLFLLLLCLIPAMPEPLMAQQSETPTLPLEDFVLRIARFWAGGDAEALVSLAPAEGRIMIDTGAGTAGSVQGRHATAALRALFAERETVSIRPLRATIAGGTPVRGFGELVWVSRSRGVTIPDSATVYVGAIWEGDAWRIRELRVLQ